MELHRWQSECLSLWENNGYRGIVNAVTGTGKTFLALSAISHLETASDKDLRVKIIVPQTFLAWQWRGEVKRALRVKSRDIGMYYGSRKDHDKKYMIYVINSARYNLARHILTDINSGFAVFLIADECHHYGSPENIRSFDFFRALPKYAPYYSLGLSATPEIPNYKDITTPLGDEIYRYDFIRALNDGIISKFILFSIRLDFDCSEAGEYQKLSEDLSIALKKLWQTRPELLELTSIQFFSRLRRLAALSGDDEVSSNARAAIQLIGKRRTISHLASARIPCALRIVSSLPPDARVILFCERVKSAEALAVALQENYPGQVGIYHSLMEDAARQSVLDSYKRGALRLLVCCRALDEGLNIPSTDAGIIVASTMSIRQRIQRLGRLLRHSKDIKRIYYLYIDAAREEEELVLGLDELKDTALNDAAPSISLQFKMGAFYNEDYETLRARVHVFLQNRNTDKSLREAINRNLDLALARGDFLLPESVCRERHRLASADRNYWASVIYAVLARTGKL